MFVWKWTVAMNFPFLGGNTNKLENIRLADYLYHQNAQNNEQ